MPMLNHYGSLVILSFSSWSCSPIILSILAYTKAKSHDPKINEALDTGIAVGKVATATANKALENKQNIKTLIDLGLQTLPQDTQQAIASKQALIDETR